jgi:NAD(P)-dependent dehydrogenase (short-subunit alcohol dehydrogenase family)
MGHRYFQDKVAVVTGAASGIGAALVQALADQGAIVVGTDLSAEGVDDARPNIQAGALDVTDFEAIKALTAQLMEQHGRIDLWFNNAGVGLAGEVRDLEIADWKPIIDVNLWGVIYGVQAVYPIMVSQGFGHIINTASGAGLCPRPGMVPYATSKYAVVGLSTSLREEAAALGVRVSAVCPGYIGSPIVGTTPFKNVDGVALMEGVPLKPMSPEKCAQVMLRGTRKNRPIIPVSKVTWLEWMLQRWAPWLIRVIARHKAQKFHEHRIDREA